VVAELEYHFNSGSSVIELVVEQVEGYPVDGGSVSTGGGTGGGGRWDQEAGTANTGGGGGGAGGYNISGAGGS
jgi:hypothetical protein